MIVITTKKLDDPKSVCPPENDFELEKIQKNQVPKFSDVYKEVEYSNK